MKVIYSTGLFLSLLCIVSCQKPLFPDKEKQDKRAQWEVLEHKSERVINQLFASPFELYAISDNQFFRFNGAVELLEKRPLDASYGVRGIPALSDNAFARMTIDEQTRQILEFHLTRNPAQVEKIPVDSLATNEDSYLEVEFLARTLGAFSTDGSLFLLPARTFAERHYAFFLFKINFNTAHNSFTSIKAIKRIDVPEMSSDFTNLINMRFLNGNFYLTSREGAWRITPSGQVQQIFSQWMRDAFSQNGKLYITGLNAFDLHESADNGLTWKRLNLKSELKMVETPGGLLLSQEVLGNPYQLVTEDYLRAQAIVYPSDAPGDFSSYYGVAFLNGLYFFSIGNHIFSTSEVVAE